MPTQSDLRFTFTVGDKSFEVVEFTLQEGLSETFLLHVDLASAQSAIDFGAVLDRAALLTIWHGDKPVRYVHGAVSSFVQGDMATSLSGTCTARCLHSSRAKQAFGAPAIRLSWSPVWRASRSVLTGGSSRR